MAARKKSNELSKAEWMALLDLVSRSDAEYVLPAAASATWYTQTAALVRKGYVEPVGDSSLRITALGQKRVESSYLNNPGAHAPYEDRKGHTIRPGDRVRIKLHPRGTAEGVVVVSPRGQVVMPDGTTLPALVVDVDGRTYGMPSPSGVVLL